MAEEISNILSSGENSLVEFKEETPVHEANENHLDRYKIQEYFQSVYEYNLDQEDPNNYKRLLQNSGLLTEDGFATVVGLVIFGKRDTTLVPPVHYTQKFLPHAGAIYAHYAGSQITDELLDRVNFESIFPYGLEKP